MTGSFLAEILKLRKRPATWVLLGVTLALELLFGYLLPYSSWVTSDQNFQTQGLDPQAVLTGTLPAELVPTSLGGFPVFAGALALILGALAAGSEYGWGTMQTALTQRPTRLAVYGGKLAALAAATLAVVLAVFAVNAVTAGLIATLESRPLDYPSLAALAEGVGSGWLIMGMWCGLGAVLGFAFRGVALPVGLGVVWVLGVENLVSAVADSLLTGLRPLRDLLPGVNAGSLVWSLAPGGGASGEPPPGVIDAVSGGRASIALATYVLGFAVAGALLARRRDVT
ncbi:MAG TPA: ABC transporter permease [Actinomycetota bacterium]|jgi:ABC-2 type transport system permease protein|nr:ABC transporter permease [Actinomycetota bacterium]